MSMNERKSEIYSDEEIESLIDQQFNIGLEEQLAIEQNQSIHSFDAIASALVAKASNLDLFFDLEHLEQNLDRLEYQDSDATRLATRESQVNYREIEAINIVIQKIKMENQLYKNLYYQTLEQKQQLQVTLKIKQIKLLNQMQQIKNQRQQFEKIIVELKADLEQYRKKEEKRLKHYCKMFDRHYKNKIVQQSSVNYLDELVQSNIKRLKFQYKEQKQLKQQQYLQKIDLNKQIKMLKQRLKLQQYENISKQRIIKQMFSQIDKTISNYTNKGFDKESLTYLQGLEDTILKLSQSCQKLTAEESFNRKQEIRILKQILKEYPQMFEKFISIVYKSANNLNQISPNFYPHLRFQSLNKEHVEDQFPSFQQSFQQQDDIMSQISF